MQCPVMSYDMSMVWSDFGQPVYWISRLCSCVAGEFAWYVLPWNLLALCGTWFQGMEVFDELL